MRTTRRTFLGQVGATSLLSIGALPPAFLCRSAAAAEQSGQRATDGRALVLIQLAGGNDGLNTVIPIRSDEYYKNRPGIGIGKGAALSLTPDLGLHPSMGGFKKLYDEGVLSIVQGVGYPNPNRSHFRSMDIWHTAQPETEKVDFGWLGRALDATAARHAGGVPALALGLQRLPLALVAAKVNVPTVQDLSHYRLDVGRGEAEELARRKKLLTELAATSAASGSELDFLRKTAATAYASAEKLQQLAAAYKPAGTYPNTGLGQKLRSIAQMIAGEFGTEIFFVSLDGFDTHSQQAKAHTALLAELTEAVRAFYFDLKGHGLAKRVLVATFSEFGRRVKENASLGTDHGAASQMFVIGPTKKPGPIGKHPSLTDLVEGDLKFHTDFRSVYATLLERWLGYPSQPALGQKVAPLEFV